MNSSAIRFTDTNSSNDSAGRTWGLDGSLFWVIIGGAAASVAIVLFLFSAMHCDFFPSLAAAATPSVLAVVYVLGFRQGKPPGYDVDLLDTLLHGRGFGPDLQPRDTLTP